MINALLVGILVALASFIYALVFALCVMTKENPDDDE